MWWRSTPQIAQVACGGLGGAAGRPTDAPFPGCRCLSPPEVLARRTAALAHVRKYGDPVLKTPARTVDRFDEALLDQVRRMGELMSDAMGVGLAANQVGVLNRVLVYRVQQQAPVSALINPEIEWSGDEEETLEEGCLSLPGVHVDVERPIFVRVRRPGRARRHGHRRAVRVDLGTSVFGAAAVRLLADSAHRPAIVASRPDRPRVRGRRLAPPQ